MEVKQKFIFCTVVCDGCACRADSHVSVEYDNRLRDEADLLAYLVLDKGWTAVDKEHDKYLCEKCSEDKKHRKYPGEGRVIREADELYGVRCDLCGRIFVDDDDTGGEFFTDSGFAADKARGEYGWNTIPFGSENGKDYCPDCWHRCKILEEDPYGDCEECPNWDWCLGEGDIPNDHPNIRGATCYVNDARCKYYTGKRENAKCTLPKGEKCLRLLKAQESQSNV